jgi:hypothetical protein
MSEFALKMFHQIADELPGEDWLKFHPHFNPKVAKWPYIITGFDHIRKYWLTGPRDGVESETLTTQYYAKNLPMLRSITAKIVLGTMDAYKTNSTSVSWGDLKFLKKEDMERRQWYELPHLQDGIKGYYLGAVSAGCWNRPPTEEEEGTLGVTLADIRICRQKKFYWQVVR